MMTAMNKNVTDATILVVDEYPSLCDLIEIILARVGYGVLTARNGHDALELAQEAPRIDLAVINAELPSMRGDELALLVAELHPAVGVVFLSTSNEMIRFDRAYELLVKPFTVEELRNAVRRALRVRQAATGMLHAA